MIVPLLVCPNMQMQFDPSAIDAQLTALGAPHPNALQLARSYVGTLPSLGEVDQALDALLSASPGVVLPQVAPAKPKSLAPAAVAPAANPESLAPAALDLSSVLEPEEEPALELAADAEEPSTGLRPGLPTSEDAELKTTAAAEAAAPRESLPAPAESVPSSGSFNLGDAADGLEEDGDADFEAEFAALSNVDHSGALPRPVSEPAPAAQAEPAQAEPAEAAPAALAIEEDDPEADAVLSLFDAMDDVPEESSASPIDHDALFKSAAPVSPSKRPSLRVEERDPDAEFDALFDEASQPTNLPPTAATDEGSMDDLLRDLGAPAMPQGLAPKHDSQFPADGELDDPTEIFDMRSLDSMPPSQEAKPAFPDDHELPSTDFEIVLDDDLSEEDVAGAASESSPPPSPSKPPKLPERPSLLGRLFKGGK